MNPIDIIIITYNRKQELHELLINIEQLEYKDIYLNKVIIIDNNITNDNGEMVSQIRKEINYSIDYHKPDFNLGVARGRNLGINKSSADLLFFIDDDAEIASTDALKKIIHYISTQPEDTAVFSLRILYFHNHELQKSAFPHKKFNKYKNKGSFNTSYFIGAGHIIRRNCLLTTNLYPEDIFYGMEEYDLSYQIISKGYKLKYTDCATILHKESARGRQSNLEKSRSLWMNKSIIIYTYLPSIYFISATLLWSFKFLIDTRLNLKEFVKTFILILDKLRSSARKPLSKNNLQYLSSVEARLWY